VKSKNLSSLNGTFLGWPNNHEVASSLNPSILEARVSGSDGETNDSIVLENARERFAVERGPDCLQWIHRINAFHNPDVTSNKNQSI
jgi:hypothetical protein